MLGPRRPSKTPVDGVYRRIRLTFPALVEERSIAYDIATLADRNGVRCTVYPGPLANGLRHRTTSTSVPLLDTE